MEINFFFRKRSSVGHTSNLSKLALINPLWYLVYLWWFYSVLSSISDNTRLVRFKEWCSMKTEGLNHGISAAPVYPQTGISPWVHKYQIRRGLSVENYTSYILFGENKIKINITYHYKLFKSQTSMDIMFRLSHMMIRIPRQHFYILYNRHF